MHSVKVGVGAVMDGAQSSSTVHSDKAGVSAGKTKVLAIASAGGHWVQMERLLPAMVDCEVVYVSTKPDLLSHDEQDEHSPRFYTVVDANARTLLRVLILFTQILKILWKERPPVVISTGAAPGCLAIALGKLLGAKTIWIDSIANSERLSLSGRLVSPLADVWLTQWEGLSSDSFLGRKPGYAGNVL